MVALGLLVVITRRRTTPSRFVALQALLLGVYALTLAPERSTEFLIASLILLVRALPLCALLAFSVQTHPGGAPAALARCRPLLRLGLVIAAVFVVLVPGPVVRSHHAGRPSRPAWACWSSASPSIVARRPTIFHLLGLIVAENGVALAAVAVPGGLPLLIELGVAFDLIVLVTVAMAFHQRIFGEFGTGDTASPAGSA